MGIKKSLSKISNKLKKFWDRLGEPDIVDGYNEGLSKEEAKELEEITKVSNPEIEKKLERIQSAYSARIDERKALEAAKKNSLKAGKTIIKEK